MFCQSCGVENTAENKFCKGCGATLGAAGAAPAASAAAPPPPPPPTGMPPAPPPGMVPMMYQAYPGGPQQVYYVPAAQAHPHQQAGLLDGLRSKIRELASTDRLEGFSFKELFNETFKKRGADAIEDYMMVGSTKTTPPLEQVDTNWPKPWLFFRVLAGLSIAYVAIYMLFKYSLNEKPMLAIMVLGTFAVPVATLTLIWELNTPRNVSIDAVIKVFVIGGGIAVVLITLGYLLPVLSSGAFYVAGPLEESSKLLAVMITLYGARSLRYPYQLNGILFGATVGAAFACSETMGYGMDSFVQTLMAFIQNGGMQQLFAGLPQGATVPYGQILMPAMVSAVNELTLRAVLSPFGHVVWTGITAGALWRVKGANPLSFGMLLDKRFLGAFIIPVVLHSIWDSPLGTTTPILYVTYPVLAIVSWYVMFTMIQQGLHQVRDMQKAQLQGTLANVEATLGLGTYRQPMAPPVGAVPVA